MKKIITKFFLILGILTFLFILYIASYVLVYSTIIGPYEKEHRFEGHSFRPFYNAIYYPLRWFNANNASLMPEKIKVYYGTLEKPFSQREESDMRSAMMELADDTSMSIGFTGTATDLEAFDKISYGSYVKLTFGQALAKNKDRFINRLISSEVIELMDDPRIPDEEISKQQGKNISSTINNLDKKSEARICVDKFIDDYKRKVLEHCQQAGYAQNIGGGCYHIIGYSISKTVLNHALIDCKIEIQSTSTP